MDASSSTTNATYNTTDVLIIAHSDNAQHKNIMMVPAPKLVDGVVAAGSSSGDFPSV
jgi:hypothetical protein